MAINLSNLTFTEQADVVPLSGRDEIINDYYDDPIVNALPGDDIITGTWTGIQTDAGIRNYGTLNTGEGNDIITGITPIDKPFFAQGISTIGHYLVIDVYDHDNPVGGIIDTGDGNDTIIGSGGWRGITIQDGTINTGKGNDIITATGYSGLSTTTKSFLNTGEGDDVITAISIDDYGFDGGYGIFSQASLDTGSGNDIIIGTGTNNSVGVSLSGDSNTGDGNDTITGSGRHVGFGNGSIFNAGNGEDSIISHGRLRNSGELFLGDGNDSIIVDTIIEAENIPNHAIQNYNSSFIGTGDGNDVITSTGVIYNEGVIETGNGDDSIIVDGGVNGTGEGYGIYNNGGAINTGNGNDSIIANEGFESGSNSSGAWFLGEGEDYIKGYGSGDFYGGNGFDTLELTPGTYTVGIWGGGWDTSVIFTKGDQLMITSEFEKLKAGSTIYDFTSLTAGQIIVVA
jgi:hypothetical protein